MQDQHECDRIKAVLASADGYSHNEIAKLLVLEDKTIRCHLEDYFEHHNLAPENGSKRQLCKGERNAM